MGRKKLIKKKREIKRIPLYKKCEKCGSHSYLTVGKFYFCTNNDCLHKEYQNVDDKCFQDSLKTEGEENE